MDFTLTDVYGQEKGPLEHCGVNMVLGTDNDFQITIQNSLYDKERHGKNIELNEDGSVKLNILDYQNGVNHLICLGAGEVEQRQQVDLYAWPDGSIRKEQYYTGIDLIEQYYENTTVDTLAELEEEGRDKFEELKNYKQLKISVDDTDLELGDIVGGRERITNIYMAAPVIRKIVDVTGRGRTSISYKLKGEE